MFWSSWVSVQKGNPYSNRPWNQARQLHPATDKEEASPPLPHSIHCCIDLFPMGILPLLPKPAGRIPCCETDSSLHVPASHSCQDLLSLQPPGLLVPLSPAQRCHCSALREGDSTQRGSGSSLGGFVAAKSRTWTE